MPMYIADAPKAEIKLNGYQASKWANTFYDVPLTNNKHLHITRTPPGNTKTIDQILSTFKFTDLTSVRKTCTSDTDCGESVCNAAFPSTCYSYKCVQGACETKVKKYGNY